MGTDESSSQDGLAESMEHLSLQGTTATNFKTQEDIKREIRLQVEYYFSDENLRCDNFLLSRMKGRKNKPVPLALIHSFNKMKSFQPFSRVVEAVKESELLNVVVVDNKECVERRIPYLKPNSDKKKKVKPTGFEENWTEAPITPDEYAQDCNLYNCEEYSFTERMETALHRYRSRRRFQPRVSNIYTKFLSYGGIETGQKQYSGGVDRDDIADKTASEIAVIKAIDFIGEDKYVTGPGHKWEVAFEEVAKGFLSSYAPAHLGTRTDAEVKDIVNVLRNFYNYLLLHNVCPEYTESILAAREVCNAAERELKMIIRATSALPGSFQMACSTLFGGHFKGMYVEDDEWYQDFKGDQIMTYMSDEKARAVINSAVHTPGLVNLFADGKYLLDENLRFAQKILTSEERFGLEVTKIISPCEEGNESSELAGAPTKRLGRLVCKAWHLPTFTSFGRPVKPPGTDPATEYVFAVDEDALGCCFEGMKLETTVHTLDSGFRFFDNVLGVYCSFYTLNYSEILKHRKKKAKEYFKFDRQDII